MVSFVKKDAGRETYLYWNRGTIFAYDSDIVYILGLRTKSQRCCIVQHLTPCGLLAPRMFLASETSLLSMMHHLVRSSLSAQLNFDKSWILRILSSAGFMTIRVLHQANHNFSVLLVEPGLQGDWTMLQQRYVRRLRSPEGSSRLVILGHREMIPPANCQDKCRMRLGPAWEDFAAPEICWICVYCIQYIYIYRHTHAGIAADGCRISEGLANSCSCAALEAVFWEEQLLECMYAGGPWEARHSRSLDSVPRRWAKWLLMVVGCLLCWSPAESKSSWHILTAWRSLE